MGGGDEVPAVGQSVCGAQERVEGCCKLRGAASAAQSPVPCGRRRASSSRRRCCRAPTARRPPARSPAPPASAPKEEVGNRAGHGPPELNCSRGALRPSPAPRPRCPRASSPFAQERRGKEGD